MNPPAKVTDGLLGVLTQKSGAEAGKKFLRGFALASLKYVTAHQKNIILLGTSYKLTCLKMLLSFE